MGFLREKRHNKLFAAGVEAFIRAIVGPIVKEPLEY